MKIHQVANIENHRCSARNVLLRGLNAFSGPFAKLRKASISFVMSVRPHGKTRVPLEGFSLKIAFEYFSKIFGEYSSFIKI